MGQKKVSRITTLVLSELSALFLALAGFRALLALFPAALLPALLLLPTILMGMTLVELLPASGEAMVVLGGGLSAEEVFAVGDDGDFTDGGETGDFTEDDGETGDFTEDEGETGDFGVGEGDDVARMCLFNSVVTFNVSTVVTVSTPF